MRKTLARILFFLPALFAWLLLLLAAISLVMWPLSHLAPFHLSYRSPEALVYHSFNPLYCFQMNDKTSPDPATHRWDIVSTFPPP